MSVEITNPWTGQVDYRYDYVDQADGGATSWPSRGRRSARGRR